MLFFVHIIEKTKLQEKCIKMYCILAQNDYNIICKHPNKCSVLERENKMLEFKEMQDCNGNTFYRAVGQKYNTPYTISKNKSYAGNRYKVATRYGILCTNCTFETAVRLANEYEDNLKEPKSFKLII